MPEIVVEYEGGTRFAATSGGYTVTTGRGDDAEASRDGMWPAQLFAASIGMCIGGYILIYCNDQGIAFKTMRIDLDRETARLPSRTTKVYVKIFLDAELSEKEAKGILRAADRCHITNSIRNSMEIICSLEPWGST